MELNFDMPKFKQSIIKVIGVGGGGCNAVAHMHHQGIQGVNFIVANTDEQALDASTVGNQIHLGPNCTSGWGAGAKPEVGKNATVESLDDIKKELEDNTKMLFITAGMGGGTGTGGAPIVAKAAKEMGILSVGIVTTPFSWEGPKRKKHAQEGIEEMKKYVDALIIVSNDKLSEMFGNMKVTEAYSKADDILATAAKSIAEIVTKPGIINVDFNDVETVMKEGGVAIMGSALGKGESRATEAVRGALMSPLLNDNDITGAKNVLINITSSHEHEMTMDEMSYITNFIQEEAGNQADVIWGHCFDNDMMDEIMVTVIATGFEMGNKKYVPLQKEVVNVISLNADEQEVKEKLKSHDLSHMDAIESTVADDLLSTTDEIRIIRKDGIEEAKSADESSEKEHAINRELSQDDLKQLKVKKDRQSRLKELSLKISTLEGVSVLEDEPAYKRRNVELTDVPDSKESKVSRFGLYDALDSQGTELKKNQYLHDNVD